MPIPCHHLSPSLRTGAALHADRDSIKVGFHFAGVKGSSTELRERCVFLKCGTEWWKKASKWNWVVMLVLIGSTLHSLCVTFRQWLVVGQLGLQATCQPLSLLEQH